MMRASPMTHIREKLDINNGDRVGAEMTMTSATLAGLTEKRKRWVEANQENGFAEGITRLLTDLYPDNAHFIYELLQNAEDTKATEVRFRLLNDRVQFEHNGTRKFTVQDVESITSLGASTKRNDPTSIGKFGVGFKAIFAYTNSPEIASDGIRFRIKDLVVPEFLGSEARSSSTAFSFPFDNPKKKPAVAEREIKRGLLSLTDSTLLFLNNIRKIDYRFADSRSGSIERIDVSSNGTGERIDIRCQSTGGEERVSHWLRYRKEVSIVDEDDNEKKCTIAIVFRLQQNLEDPELNRTEPTAGRSRSRKQKSEWRITACEPGQVSIFFPAEKETSKLRFHMHAPFASTVARDSVRDCQANDDLRDKLAELTAEALTDIRNLGLLTVEFLASLPNEEDGLSDFYEPIRDAIVEAFQNEDLLPTKSGSHRRTGQLYRGPREVSSVLSDADLSLLIGHDSPRPLWAANALKSQREDKFIESLEIDPWSWSELQNLFVDAVDDEELASVIKSWIATKDDRWLMDFYALMESCHNDKVDRFGCSELVDAWPELALVRVVLSTGTVKLANPRAAFFPQEIPVKGNWPPGIPPEVQIVKAETYNTERFENIKKSARSFLERVGVRRYDERAEVERRLETYLVKRSRDGHFDDIVFFASYLRRNPLDAGVFNDRDFLLGCADDGQTYWVEPDDCFLDRPFEETGLKGLHHIHDKHSISDQYQLELAARDMQLEHFVSFLRSLGVFERLQVVQVSAQWNRKIRYSHTNSEYEINQDYNIDNLDDYVTARNASASRLIWEAITNADKISSFARWRKNGAHSVQEAPSQLVQALRSAAWVPDRNGDFRKPDEMTVEALPKEFPYNDRNGLLTAIGFGQQVARASEEFKVRDAEAKSLGFDSASDLDEAHELLRAKREGRIKVIPDESAEGGGSAGRNKESKGATDTSATGREQDASNRPVLQRINDRVRQPDAGAATQSPDQGEPGPEEADEDFYTPAPVDYQKRIARAEARNATDIGRLEREQELVTLASSLPRYSYGWFSALLELECLASSEKSAYGKTLYITFGKIERDATSSRTIVLREPNRFIPQSVEELSGVRVDLQFRDGRSSSFHVDSFTAKEFALHGKLKSADGLDGIDLSAVVEARIDVQNPSFLLQEQLNRFRELGLAEDFDMKANLPREIEFVFGPPGTGKTTHLAEKVLIPLMMGKKDVRILVLAPTNKAADVLTTRIMDMMGSDRSVVDWLVRFGTSSDERIEREGIWRDRSFDIDALDRCVIVSTVARYSYDGFAGDGGKLHELDWDFIVFDEASMIPLVNMIYPLHRQSPDKFIIAGDPFQIEPIVAVDQWKDENIYSLVGLNKAGAFASPVTEPHVYPVTNLETQYRSIPAIGEVFSHFTYSGILKHHRQESSQRPLRVQGLALRSLNLIRFPVSRFESIYRARRLKTGTPYQTYSALFTFEFVKWLSDQIHRNHAGESPFRIGIIAPYRAQANLLSKLSDSQLVKHPEVIVQVGTIHGFQGDECDIIVAVFNPPPTITTSSQMFLNKQNILNVAISRARDYLFVVMPDRETEDYRNLRKLIKIEALVKESSAFADFDSHDVEEVILGNRNFLEENSFSTGHQMVNVYRKPERYYEVRSDDSAIDVQIHDKG